MRSTGKFKKFYDIRTHAGLAFTGLVILLIALAALIFSNQGEWEEVDAKILSIETVNAGEGKNAEEEDHEVTVEYVVHGKKYTEELPAYSSSWEEGQVIKCKYDPKDPAQITSKGGLGIAAVFAIFGLAVFTFGTAKAVRAVRTPAEEYDEHDRAVMYEPDPEVVKQIETSTEPAQNYVFHFTGKYNQSHVMKNEAGEHVYEGNCRQMQAFRDTDYDFFDNLTEEAEAHKIGHTVTRSVGTVMGISAPISSSFTIDGEDIWDWFARQGYGFTWSHRGITSIFSVTRWQIPIAQIEEAGTEIMGEKYEGKIGAKLPTKGLYRITCRESDRKAIFMLAFTLSRIELFTTAD